MTEYIEREAVFEWFCNFVDDDGCVDMPKNNGNCRKGYRDCVCGKELDAIPAADVVEVVRCKDCRFCMAFKDKSDGFYGHCRRWIIRTISDYAALVYADGYCSYGERKEADNG